MIVNYISIIAIVGILLTFIFGVCKNLPHINSKIIGYFFPIFLFGIVLNFTALVINGGAPISLLFLQSIANSFEFFKLKVSISPIAELSNQYILYNIAQTLYISIALLSTVSATICLLFQNSINKIRIWFCRNKPKYILIGDSKNFDYVEKVLKTKKVHCFYVAKNISKEEKRRLSLGKFNYFEGTLSAALKNLGALVENCSVQLISLYEKDEDNFRAAMETADYLRLRASEKVYYTSEFCGVFFYSNIERADHFRFAEEFGGRIRFESKYDLIARQFLETHPITKYLPPSLIDNSKATLSEDVTLSHLFVGLGNTNIQLLKKTVMNAQFLNTDFCAHVFDKKLCDSFLKFKNYAYGLFAERNITEEGYPISEEKFSFFDHEINVVTDIFYQDIIEVLEKNSFNIVYIALGDDLLNMETALEIRRTAYRAGLIDRLKIFFKSNQSLTENNLLYINADFADDYKITQFGTLNEVFTADTIFHERLDYIAKRINNVYTDFQLNGKEINNNWSKLSLFKKDSNRFAAYGIVCKLHLLGYDLVQDGKEEGFDLFNKSIQSNADFPNINRRENLARVEHLRWNVFHLANGWRQMPLKKITFDRDANKLRRADELLKEHACLTTFEGLNKLRDYSIKLLLKEGIDRDEAFILSETIKYDYMVLDELKKVFAGSGYSIIKNKID